MPWWKKLPGTKGASPRSTGRLINSLHLDYEIPTIETVFVTPAGVPATGAGETAITVTPAAIGNAIFDATGVRLRHLPFTPARVKAELDKSTRDKAALLQQAAEKLAVG